MGFSASKAASGSEFAAKLRVQRIVNEDVSAGDLVKADDDTSVSLATQNATLQDAQVFGMALEDKLTGETVDVLLTGVAEFAIFNVFNENEALFLDVDGAITNVRPTTGKLLDIGKHLGGNQVLLSIGKITVLT